LSVDPERLHIELNLPSTFGSQFPVLYFDARTSGLLNRPHEITELWRIRREPGDRFSWSDPATAGPQLVFPKDLGADPLDHYARLNTLRPWWISHWYMPERERPIPVWNWLAYFGASGVVGAGLLVLTVRRNEHS